ncbi:MAG: DsbA family protein [Alphaproteobacteria bacterium]
MILAKRLLAAAGAVLVLSTGMSATVLGQDKLTPIPEGALTLPTVSNSTAEPTFSDAQRGEIGDIIREYLVENPDVIVEVLQILQTRQQAAAQQAQQPARVDVAAVYNEGLDPVIGNPNGSVTVVEFFDYHCPFCKRISSSIVKLIEADDDIRVVFKEFPVFGDDSVFAARASLASMKQDLYHEYHIAMMKNRGRLTERTVMKLAKKVGLDVDQLKEDMEAPEINETIQANYALAQQLGIRGTPSFIIGDEIVPGALDINTMRRLIQSKRQS